MTPLFLTDLSTSAVNYEYDGVSDYGRAQLCRVDEWQCQLDFYGDQAQTMPPSFAHCPLRIRMHLVQGKRKCPGAALFRPPRQTSMINGEKQWESR